MIALTASALWSISVLSVIVSIAVGIVISFVVFDVVLGNSSTSSPTITVTNDVQGGIPTTTPIAGVTPTISTTVPGGGGGGGGGQPASYSQYSSLAVVAPQNTYPASRSVTFPAAYSNSAPTSISILQASTALTGVPCSVSSSTITTTGFQFTVNNCGGNAVQYTSYNTGAKFQPVQPNMDCTSISMTPVNGVMGLAYRTGSNPTYGYTTCASGNPANWSSSVFAQVLPVSTYPSAFQYTPVGNFSVQYSVGGISLINLNGQPIIFCNGNGRVLDVLLSTAGTSMSTSTHLVATTVPAVQKVILYGGSQGVPLYDGSGNVTGVGIFQTSIGNQTQVGYFASTTKTPNYSTNWGSFTNAYSNGNNDSYLCSAANQPTGLFPCLLIAGNLYVLFINTGTPAPTYSDVSTAFGTRVTLTSTMGPVQDGTLKLVYAAATVSGSASFVPVALWTNVNYGLYYSFSQNLSGTSGSWLATPLQIDSVPIAGFTATTLASGAIGLAYLTRFGELKYVTMTSSTTSGVISFTVSSPVIMNVNETVYPALSMAVLNSDIYLAYPVSPLPCTWMSCMNSSNSSYSVFNISNTSATNVYNASSASANFNSRLIGSLLSISDNASPSTIARYGIPCGLITATTANTLTTLLTQNLNSATFSYSILNTKGIAPYAVGTASQSGTTITLTNSTLHAGMIGSTITFANGVTSGPILSVSALWTQYNTGTVALSANSNTVTGTGTTWTSAMVGGTILTGTSGTSGVPLGVIVAVNSATSLIINVSGNGAVTGGTSYNIIYPASTTATATVATSQTVPTQAYTMNYYYSTMVQGFVASASCSTTALSAGFTNNQTGCIVACGNISVGNWSGIINNTVTNPQTAPAAFTVAFSGIPNFANSQLMCMGGVITLGTNAFGTLTGTNTNWGSSLVGGLMYFASGQFAGVVTAVSGATGMTVSQNLQTASALGLQYAILVPNCPIKVINSGPNNETFSDSMTAYYSAVGS